MELRVIRLGQVEVDDELVIGGSSGGCSGDRGEFGGSFYVLCCVVYSVVGMVVQVLGFEYQQLKC